MNVLRLLFSLQGRINRLGFLRGALLLLVPCAVAYGLAIASVATLSDGLLGVAALLLVVPLISLACMMLKRLHDMGFSGWLVLILLAALLVTPAIEDYAFSTLGASIVSTDVPLYIQLLPIIPWATGVMFLIVGVAWPGQIGDNRFGPDPALVARAPAKATPSSKR